MYTSNLQLTELLHVLLNTWKFKFVPGSFTVFPLNEFVTKLTLLTTGSHL